jgi:hypothetical protein
MGTEGPLSIFPRRDPGGITNGRKGHQDAFLRPRLSARYRFSQGTLAGTHGNGRDAPKSSRLGSQCRA